MSQDSELETAPITVTRDGDQVRITVGDEVVATGPDVPRLVEAAHALGESDPLKLRVGASLLLDLPQSERAAVFVAVGPHSTMSDELREREEELSGAYLYSEKPPIEAGISVDEQPWGWWHLASDPSTDGPNEDGWRLIPAWPAETVLHAAADFVGYSMGSGPVKDIGIRRWASLAAVSWSQEYEGGRPASTRVNYEIEDTDWDGLFLRAFSGFFHDDFSICPGCEEEEGNNYSVSVEAHPMFSNELIGQALTEIYRPCEEHEGTPEVLIVKEVAGHDWRWIGDSWMACSVEDGEGLEDNPRSSSGGTWQR
jgi:hypothetical protein